jgi:uncharacterized membrane protein (UPF0127 family)
MKNLLLSFSVSSLLLVSSVHAACTVSTPEIDRMEIQTIVIEKQASIASGLDSIEIDTRVADDPYERAAGFQHVCAQAAKDYPIYFQFERSFISSFHMQNVFTDLDIAFIDEANQIISIQRMKPNSLVALRQNLYSPPSPAWAALETAPGYYEENGIKIGDKVILLP